GEWPRRGQTAAEGPRATLALMRGPPRAEIARDFVAFAADHRHDAAASEEIARVMHDLYVAFLTQARDRHGLTFLQPGRFLCRGALGDLPYLWFAPLDVPETIEPAPRTL